MICLFKERTYISYIELTLKWMENVEVESGNVFILVWKTYDFTYNKYIIIRDDSKVSSHTKFNLKISLIKTNSFKLISK